MHTLKQHTIRLMLALAILGIGPLQADSGFNRCKKFSSYPAMANYTGPIYPPVAPRGVPERLQRIIPYIKDPQPNYAGYLYVIEAPLKPSGYGYWFWDLRSGRLMTGPSSEQAALWRTDSRLFIAPAATSQASDFDQQGYRGDTAGDNARYYLWDENQHDPTQSELLLLPCTE